ncbi:helix-turn-helix domain-containing protein [Nitrosomonas ureae]|uniref:HTH cro/C1-type domain-containing protein n=1 Tax=Nitrosomonas ureae TaxID=44577 RepID=A0A1H9HI97_9PROT|nr:helix-turn-helix domain-containing protein [Nitrosomonas ureae]SEQ62008.1 hypothetical protein SAMN05421510_11114 [Nitrosomonas ureae]
MDIKNYIETAEKKAGKQIELAKMLGISDAYIRMVKAGKRGFPDDICIQLADYIQADRLEVIAASNLVTEKDERKRKIFESCFNRAASVATTAVIISILTLSQTSPVYAGSKQSIYNNTNYTQLQAQEIQEE